MDILKTLSKILSISEDSVKSFAITSPYRYKVYKIPKRNSKQKRTIAHPSKELKYIQRILVKLLEDKLIVSHCAFAYKKGLGIKENALSHSKSKYLLKMDFKDFFLSITPELFLKVAKKNKILFNEEEQGLLNGFLFWKSRNSRGLKLSIGAPSSPLISNFIMTNFDIHIDNYCKLNSIIFTRYADDITFSTNIKGKLFSIPDFVEQSLKLFFHNSIQVNPEKTVFSSMRHNRHITGVTITNNQQLSLGREKKRRISSMVHRFSQNSLKDTDIKYLKGILSHFEYIEPSFLVRLAKKYGDKTMQDLKSVNVL